MRLLFSLKILLFLIVAGLVIVPGARAQPSNGVLPAG